MDVVVGVRGLAEELVEAARAWGVEAVFVETPEAGGGMAAGESARRRCGAAEGFARGAAGAGAGGAAAE